MNKTKYFTIMFFLYSICNAQTPNWEWAQSAGGSGHDFGSGITSDLNGNIYSVGSFYSTTITFGGITLTNAGSSDVFVVKYNPSGNVLWAKKFGGSAGESGLGITTDYFGGVYITGSYSSPFIIFNNDTILNNGIIYIAKYDTSGNEIWATSSGGTGLGIAYSIAADPYGNTCITGKYNSPTITFGTTTLSNSGQFDVFIAKFNTNGNPLWAKKAGGGGVEEAYSVGSDMLGNVYAAGTYWSSSISLDTATLVNGGQTNLYVVKFDASGNMLWYKSAGGITGFEFTSALGMKIDNAGNVYITGSISGSGITFGSYALSSIGTNLDMMVVKYNTNGNVIFATKAGGAYHEWGEGVSVDANGNSFVTGRFEGGPTATFGSTVLNNNGYADVHVTGLNASGNVIWAMGLGGTDWEYSNSITNDQNGNTYVTGRFRSILCDFGGISLTNATANPIDDYFIAKIGNTTGISEENNFKNLTNIYPNPFLDKLTIESSNNDLAEIILYDIASRKIMQQKFTNSIALNTEQLMKGIYIYEVKNKDGSFKKGKVVKD